MKLDEDVNINVNITEKRREHGHLSAGVSGFNSSGETVPEFWAHIH